MAGIHFSFDNFRQLIDLNIGISDRLDENRAECFSILYCDFSNLDVKVVETSLSKILRTSDAIVNYVNDYFFVLPYTDKYGAQSVKNMFEEFFNVEVSSIMVSYPSDGENSYELFEELQNLSCRSLENDLFCLDQFIQKA